MTTLDEILFNIYTTVFKVLLYKGNKRLVLLIISLLCVPTIILNAYIRSYDLHVVSLLLPYRY
jgi:hypothetical protein